MRRQANKLALKGARRLTRPNNEPPPRQTSAYLWRLWQDFVFYFIFIVFTTEKPNKREVKGATRTLHDAEKPKFSHERKEPLM